MKTSSAIKKLMPIIFLLLLLFLVPLFKDNIEYFCDYNLNDIMVQPQDDCDNFFLERYAEKSSGYSEIITANGDSADCIGKIDDLIIILNIWLSIKAEISDNSPCKMAVVNDKITNITDLIKLKLISREKCELEYNDDSLLEGSLSVITDQSIINEIRQFKMPYPLDPTESSRLSSIVATATTCMDETYDTAGGECCINGNQNLSISGYTQYTTPNYEIDDLVQSLCNR